MPIETNGNRDNKMMKPTRLSSGIGTLILFLLILNFLVLPSMSRPSRVLYSTFLQQVRAGKVAQASVSPTEIRYEEVLEGETLDAYLAKAQMPPGIDEWLKTGEVDTALAQASN